MRSLKLENSSVEPSQFGVYHGSLIDLFELHELRRQGLFQCAELEELGRCRNGVEVVQQALHLRMKSHRFKRVNPSLPSAVGKAAFLGNGSKSSR